MMANQAPNLSVKRSPGEEDDDENYILNCEIDDEFITEVPSIQLSGVLKICQINVEGLTPEKSEFIGRLISNIGCDVLLLQETHKPNNESLDRCCIQNFICVESINHPNHGIASYVKHELKNNCYVVSRSSADNVSCIVIKVNEMSILNVYKPPAVIWRNPLPILPHPAIYMGDFNSHHEMWGYSQNDENGEYLVEWALNNNIHLMFDPKDLPTFHSGRWNRGYNPDLCFVSTDDTNLALPSFKTVYPMFPRSQHRPVILEVGIQIPLTKSLPVPRWNFGKANWVDYSKYTDKNVRWIPPTTGNFDRFAGCILASAKKFVPRGFRKNYIPNWNTECETLWNAYRVTGSQETGSNLLKALNSARKDRWIKMVENLDFTHSSRKAWNLLRKLSGSKPKPTRPSPINPNSIAAMMVKNSMAPISTTIKRNVRNKLKKIRKRIRDSPLGGQVTIEEVNCALANLKPGKAAGVDGIFPEFFMHLGKRARLWLSKFFSACYEEGKIPSMWSKTKVIAVLKPGKPKEVPESYRPISLLCVGYKIFERVIYNRISSYVDTVIPVEQAGFRPGRNCCDQVLSLTTHIEAGFQDKKKTGIVLIDLRAAYDTVWKDGLLLKFSKFIKCRRTINILSAMLSNRQFTVHIGNLRSNCRRLNNGLPQGSVLAPILFNLYTSDMPATVSRKFVYADDLAIAFQYLYNSSSEKEAERVLTSDLSVLLDYYTTWRLKPNPDKSEVSTFHLSNFNANNQITVQFQNSVLKYNPKPKYLGVTLDRSLTFKDHCVNLRAKLKSRNSIIQNLTGADWGASASTLRISALSLVYSAAEYCAPVWSHSTHVRHIDTALNCTMRLITGTIKSTPLPWLPILSNVAPANIRREKALVREFEKISENLNLHIHIDLKDREVNRLSSRCPLWNKIRAIESIENYSVNDRWAQSFNSMQAFTNQHLIIDPCMRVEGFQLPRRQWITLNRIRTGHGITKYILHKWDPEISPYCDCGNVVQTMEHAIIHCPLRRFDGSLVEIHNLTKEAEAWLSTFDLKI